MADKKVIVIANNKGGTGKTLNAKVIAEYAACILDKRVMIIDLDPQTNISRRYLEMEIRGGDEVEDYAPPRHPDWPDPDDEDWDGYSSSADIWYKGYAIPYPLHNESRPNWFKNLFIIPGHANDLAKVELVTQKNIYKQVTKHFKQLLDLSEFWEDIDLVVLDTRPSKGPLTASALHAATHLLIPTEPEAPSVEGLWGMVGLRNKINLMRDENDQLEMIGILANKVQKQTVIHREHLEFLHKDPSTCDYMIPATVSHKVVYKEAMLEGAPSIWESSDKSPEVIEMKAVCEFVFAKVFP